MAEVYEVLKPGYSCFDTPEYMALIGDHITTIRDADPEELGILDVFAPLETAFQNLNAGWKISMKSPFTAVISAEDKLRDSNFSGIYLTVQGATYHTSNEAAKNAGTLLRDNIELYGVNLNNLAYQKQTSTLTSILDDWANKPELAAAVVTLGIGPWATILRTHNENVKRAYVDRETAHGASNNKSVEELRIATDAAHDRLRRRVNAKLDEAEYEGRWLTIARTLNALTKKHTEELASKPSSGSGGGDAPENP